MSDTESHVEQSTAAEQPIEAYTSAPVPADPTVAPSPALDVSPSQTERVEQAIVDWLRAHIASSPVSQSTPAWNHLVSKLGELRDFILKEI